MELVIQNTTHSDKGGSAFHLISFVRERGLLMVLGELDATEKIPDGSMVAVTDVVHWIN